MTRTLFLISLLITSINCFAQISLDSLKRSIKKVNVQKIVAEDHERLINELDSFQVLYKNTVKNNLLCMDEKDALQYELNLYEVLENIEQKNFGRIENIELYGFSLIRVDTLAGGTLQKMVIDLGLEDFGSDSGELKLKLPLGRKIAENGLWLQHHYPYTSSLLASGTILVDVGPYYRKMKSQIARLVFPPLTVQGSIDKKKKYAGDFLNSIREVCNNGGMPEYNYDDYLRLESKEVPNGNLDKLLAIRVAFLKVLKDEYDKRKTR